MVQYDNVKTLWKNFKTQLPGQGMTGPSKVIFHLHFSGCDIFYFVIILIEFCLNKVFGSNVYCFLCLVFRLVPLSMELSVTKLVFLVVLKV